MSDISRWLAEGALDRVEEIHAAAYGHEPRSARVVELEMAFHEEGGPLLARMIARGVRTGLPSGQIAAVLAQERSIASLERIVTENAERDAALPLLACLVSETALRGKRIQGARGAGLLQARMNESKHPYRALPWTSTPLEARAKESLRHYSVTDGSSIGLPFGPRNGTQKDEDTNGIPNAVEALPLEPLEAAAQLVSGFIESFAYAARFPDAPRTMSRLLLSRCALPILEGVQPGQIYLEDVYAEGAFQLLLLANMGVIPYGEDFYGAECRYRAWRAMGQLAGVADVAELDVARIEAEVRKCEWCYFDAPGGWFIQEYCDLGVVALRPDKKSLALIAGTATD